MYLSAFEVFLSKYEMHLSDKSLLPAAFFRHHTPKHVRKKGLLLSCDNDSDLEHQTKSTLYSDHIISRHTKQVVQTDMYTYNIDANMMYPYKY